MKRSRSLIRDAINKTSPTSESSINTNEEHSNLVKKFQLMIIHLQNELTKSVIIFFYFF